jgi:hypothetical protein
VLILVTGGGNLRATEQNSSQQRYQFERDVEQIKETASTNLRKNNNSGSRNRAKPQQSDRAACQTGSWDWRLKT